MKKVYLLFILIVTASILSCDTDDDASNKSEDKLLSTVTKFTNGLFYEQSFTYNSSNQIETIVIDKFLGGAAPYYNEIKVNYSNGLITSIQDSTDYENPILTDKNINYDVSYMNNQIVLESDEYRFEITHSNNYVDSVIQYYAGTSAIHTKAILTRDANQNLTSVSYNDDSVVNSYINFDTDKKPAPMGVVLDILMQDYIGIFNLQVTANNPTSRKQSIQGSPSGFGDYTFEYDEDGYVTKSIEPNGVHYKDILYVEN